MSHNWRAAAADAADAAAADAADAAADDATDAAADATSDREGPHPRDGERRRRPRQLLLHCGRIAAWPCSARGSRRLAESGDKRRGHRCCGEGRRDRGEGGARTDATINRAADADADADAAQERKKANDDITVDDSAENAHDGSTHAP